MLLLYSQNTDKYLSPLLDVTGKQPVSSVAISCWRSIILANAWLEHVSNVFIGYSSIGGVSGVLVDLMFLLIFFMCTFAVAMEGGRCFISSNVMLDHVVKWNLLMALSKVLCIGLNNVAWHHLDSSGLVLSARAFIAAGCF